MSSNLEQPIKQSHVTTFNLTFSARELEAFAAISRDVNPLHTDALYAHKTPFSQPVVFGVLAVLKCLSYTRFGKELCLAELSVEFHNSMFVETDYSLQITETSEWEGSLLLKDHMRTLLRLRYRRQAQPLPFYSPSQPVPVTTREVAADCQISDFPPGYGCSGVYDLHPGTGEDAKVLPRESYGAQSEHLMLMLTSYLVGMEAPGKQALFAKLELRFAAMTAGNSQLRYEWEVQSADTSLGLLFLNLHLTSIDGDPLATGQIQTFLRSQIAPAPIDRIRQLLKSEGGKAPLAGKTALVIGGSRGLGAEIVQALALSGARVYLNYARSDAEAEALQAQLGDLPNAIQLVRGSVGDMGFCQELLERIKAESGAVDIVICNACSSPQPMTLADMGSAGLQKYLQSNLALVANPLAVFAAELSGAKGVFCAISSIYVATGSKDFPQYVALKQTVEGLLKSASLVQQNISFLVARPPKLLTDMSNTPVGAIGAMAPEIVATQLAIALADNTRDTGNFRLLEHFAQESGARETNAGVTEVNLAQPPEIQAEPSSIDTAAAGPQVCIAASFSVDLILPSLEFWSRQIQLPLSFRFGPYNQPFQELLSPQSQFNRNREGHNLMLIRFEDWLPYRGKEINVDSRNHLESDDLIELIEKTFAEFLDALSQYDSQAQSAPMELIVCPSLELADTLPSLPPLFSAFESRLKTATSIMERVNLTLADDYHQAYAVTDLRDSLRWELANIPFTDNYFHVLGTLAMRRLFNHYVSPYKVIVLDCDNTLWRGVCDEAGAVGVEISAEFQGLQEFLIQQQQQGVLLCLNSKNREQAVWDVFEQHPNMRLRREHIVDFRINWQAKSANIRELATQLNLGLDSFIFIDDNPVECAEVRLQLPQVLTLQAPDNPQDFTNLIDHLWVLDKRRITAEDQNRTQLYQQDKARQQAQSQALDFSGFIASLNLEISFQAIDESNIGRAAQLSKRTNQFNLSTRRRSEGDINKLLGDGWIGLCVQVRDRFGDYGTVGLVLAQARDQHMFVDTFLLSCRVLGRGVEYRMAAYIAEMAVQQGLTSVSFEFVPSAKNEPMAHFLNKAARQLQTDQSVDMKADTSALVFPSDRLVQLRFDPTDNSDPQVSSDTVRPATSVNQASVVDIQQLLENKVFKFRSADQLAQLQPAVPSASPVQNNADLDSISQRVTGIFARVLGLDEGAISADQRLETLVEESYKIVELTVALKASYPNIPQTLLFETNCIRDIVQIISGEHLTLPLANHGAGPSVGADQEDIAIIGMSGIFPGAANIEEFWQNLKSGICSIGDIPPDRWNAEDFYSADRDRTDRSYCRTGGFIDKAFTFDHQFFGIAPREAETMDPQQRLFLQTVWGLLENAGYTRASLPRATGVYLGVISSDYALNAYPAALGGWSHYRMSDFYQIPNRVSYYYDLQGPSIAIDSACSSSATALHLACASLRRGECETAIVGGVNVISHPSRLIQYAQMQMISKKGVCSPFSDAADGTLFGEGVCALLIKPLQRALEDGDKIHGVIKSTCVNSGGKTNGFTVPNPKAHARLISKALVQAQILPSSISYIEAHGTATHLGDPIEVRGLAEGFRAAEAQLQATPAEAGESWCALGSVKSNIGHLESCAALAGIIKCLLQMKHRTLVPSLTRGTLIQGQEPEVPNPQIPFQETPFHLQYQLQEWRSNSPRRAGVSSFGAGGSNAHVIVEEAPPQPQTNDGSQNKGIAVFSAPSPAQLASLLGRVRAFLEDAEHPDLGSLCYTLQLGREHFSCRFGLVCESVEDLHQALNKALAAWPQSAHNIDNGDNINPNLTLPTADQSPESWLQHWLAGGDTPWQDLYPKPQVKMSLPGLEFAGREFHLPDKFRTCAPDETDTARENAFLGSRLDSPFVAGEVYESRFDLGNLPYLTDHRIYDAVVVPGSMYLAYGLTLARSQWQANGVLLRNITFIRAMLPGDSGRQPVQFSAGPADSQGIRTLTMSSRQEGQWQEHFSCQWDGESPLASQQSEPVATIKQRMTHVLNTEEFYAKSEKIGFRWGKSFQCVRELHRRDGEALGFITLTDELLPSRSQYAIHPAFLDACFQVFVPGMSSGGRQEEAKQAYLPLGVKEVHFYREVPLSVWSHVVTRDDLKKDSLTIDISLYSEQGQLIAYFKEMQVLRTSREALMALSQPNRDPRLIYEIQWQPLEAQKPSGENLFLVCGHQQQANLHTLQQVLGGRCYEGIQALPEAAGTGKPLCLLYVIKPLALNHSEDAGQLTANLLENIDTIREILRQAETFHHPQGIGLMLVTCGDSATGAQTLDQCLVSLGRVIALEYPHLWRGFARLEQSQSRQWQQLADVSELPGDHYFSISNKGVQVARLSPFAAPPAALKPLDGDACYIITGAFGSLGRLLVEQLVARGARHLLLISRREPDASARALVQRLTDGGVSVQSAALDLSDFSGLQALVQQQGSRLKGIVHLAGLLEDGAFANLTNHQFQRVLAPKLAGTWNLHRCTESLSLDFFLLFSSASSLLGAAGQSNYALANGFLDAFAAYRRELGLPALAINWGPWSGAGMAAEQNLQRKTWTNASFGSLSPEVGLKLLDQVLLNNRLPAQIAILPYHWPELFQHYPVTPPPALLQNLVQQPREQAMTPSSKNGNARPKALLTPELSRSERKRAAADYLRDQVRQILGFKEDEHIDAKRSFLQLGFDSLMAVSFRSALAKSLDCYFPATLIFDYPNVSQLAEFIVSQLAEKDAAGATSPADTAAPEVSKPQTFQRPEDISQLSQEDMEKILNSELDEIERMLEA